ncbi:hypothetical protein LK08_01780 [Streptomyces sp. MUSC 125]|nr:hypothetical protein LK08_01780 [Streptomyces sp. MUSC 125]
MLERSGLGDGWNATAAGHRRTVCPAAVVGGRFSVLSSAASGTAGSFPHVHGAVGGAAVGLRTDRAIALRDRVGVRVVDPRDGLPDAAARGAHGT